MRPVNPLTIIATSCAVGMVTPIESTGGSATNAANTWPRKRNTDAAEMRTIPPIVSAETRSADMSRARSPLPQE